MSESNRWALPLLAAGQAQKEITHNEAILAIDRLLHLAVESRTLSTPPTEPRTGVTYIVGADPDGVWVACSGKLAAFNGAGWIMTSPRVGCLAWIVDEAQFAVFDNGA